MDVRYAVHPEHGKTFDTPALRKHFLIDDLFAPGEIRLTYSHVDRIIAGSAVPLKQALSLEAGSELGVDYFFQRREAGIINIGGPGRVVTEKETYNLGTRDGLYIGAETREVRFESEAANNPADFYINSAPAHKAYPSKVITLKDAKEVNLGSAEESNERTIHQFVHPAVVDSCQLVMGMTLLKNGSIWNTMPAHTHDRRMEVYLYFNMEENTRVFHFMGEPAETRHLVVKNKQAAIMPSWSIHSGVGTGRYAFIWGMVGENQTFTDMDHIEMADLK
ncbi:5-dehydro-4-deoxy-D-glucuronate isomerase [Marispirochaeta sp.]|jgi:4-deoxy-L-threo-5-hexosulose-uronate ketol-isomerase|uniref:5-dehydro-4-deoxy-D-glucuronate isomerase n=1 Tax=Marispirochaeta sp. TaxID=2038653 RepID=UPI0029C923B5|nr:5-dehydro-4-deoxy-D-glucuronate isomerase [Marispirochaeta sp.]